MRTLWLNKENLFILLMILLLFQQIGLKLL
jgi:hypothetical protein